jgi:hypothetical protein
MEFLDGFMDALQHGCQKMELAGQYRVVIMQPAEEATRQAELLVSNWHAQNRIYLGQGRGIDWQARKALVLDIAALLVGPLTTIERMKEDTPRPVRRRAAPAKGD